MSRKHVATPGLAAVQHGLPVEPSLSTGASGDQPPSPTVISNDTANQVEHVRTLLDNKGSRFLTVLYRTLLNREPDEAGLQFYIQRLSSGITKKEVIAEVGGSSESRKVGRQVDGLQHLIAAQTSAMRRLFSPLTGPSKIERSLHAVSFQVELLFELLGDLRLQASVAAARTKDATDAFDNVFNNSSAATDNALAPIQENFCPPQGFDSLSLTRRMFMSGPSAERV